MLFKVLTAPLILLSLPFSLACNPQLTARSSTAFTTGNDGPQDPATLGYTINHFALLVHNITASRHFYGDVLGMRHIFTYQASPTYSVTYMGFSHGGKNGTGFETGAELFAEKDNIEGLIEFLYLSDAKHVAVPSTVKSNTFGHVGLIVPDVMKAQERMEQYGVKIIKRIGEAPEVGGPVAEAFGLADPKEAAQALGSLQWLGFNGFLVVVDPDGNCCAQQTGDGGSAS